MMFGSRKLSTSTAPAPEAAKQKPADVLANGKAAPVAKPIAPAAAGQTSGQPQMSDEARKRMAAALQLSAAFTQIVTVLIRSPQHKHLALADLEWLLFPPLTAGQFAVANVQAKEGGASMPAAVVLWASVSADVDQKLSGNLNAPMRLRPDEWKSGDIVWVIEAVGDNRLLPGLLKQLQEKSFKGRDAKLRMRGKDGKLAVRKLTEALRSGKENERVE